MSIYLLYRTKAQSIRYKIACSDMQETIKSLKERFINCLETTGSIEFVYRGIILEDEQTLTQTGIKPDVVVHILTKPTPKSDPILPVVSEELITQVHKFIVAINSHPHHKIAFMKINRRENLEKIMKKHPALNDDPKAKTMLLDPYLITTLTDIKALKSLAEDHPALIEAFRTIIEVLKEAKPSASSQTPGTSTGFPLSLESLMRESDSESSGSEYSASGPSTARNSESSRAITANQLATALAFANSATTSDSLPRSSSANNPSSSFISSSMFSNALNQAMNQVRPSRSERNRGQTRHTPQVSNSQGQSRSNYLAPLHMMRTMGLTDDALNIQALEICAGDAQAAINLILSGAIGNDQ